MFRESDEINKLLVLAGLISEINQVIFVANLNLGNKIVLKTMKLPVLVQFAVCIISESDPDKSGWAGRSVPHSCLSPETNLRGSRLALFLGGKEESTWP